MNRLSTDYRADPRQGAAAAAQARGDYERIFRAATRHSRRVRWLRVGIPVLLVLGVAAFALATWLSSWGLLVRLPGNLGNLVISGTKITMEQPRLTGYTRDSRAYEIVARSASQDITKPETMELHELNAKIDMQDKSTVRMTAVRGTYDSKTDILKLVERILLTSSNGYEGQLTEAVIDIKRGHVVSEKPVVLKTEDAVLNANRLEMSDNGQLMRFDGGVTMVLTPKDKSAFVPPRAAAQ
jgi:lipopolysaccharide export system protein LptC